MHASKCIKLTLWSRRVSRTVRLVSCPPRARLPARNGLVNEVEFLGLIPQNSGRPDCEIDNYYVALPYSIKIYSSPFEYPYFFEWVFRKTFWTLLGYTVAKAPGNPRNSTCSPRERVGSGDETTVRITCPWWGFLRSSRFALLMYKACCIKTKVCSVAVYFGQIDRRARLITLSFCVFVYLAARKLSILSS